jgi:hypothetical protein
MGVRDFREFMDYGLGIDDASGNIRARAVDHGDPVPVPETGGQTVLFRLHKSETVEDVHKAIGLSVDGAAAYGLFAASDKFDFAESSNFQTYSLFLVVAITVTNTSRHILDEKLVDAGKTLLGQGTDAGNKRFREEFGDIYIKGVETGGEFMAIVEIETRSDQEKQDISNKLEAGGFFGVGGADLASTFTSNFAQVTSNATLNINSFQRGGEGEGAVQQISVGALIEKARTFAIQVMQRPVSYRVQTQDYLALDLPTPPNVIDLQNAKDVLQRYETQRATLLQALNDANYVMSHSDQFEPFSADALTKFTQGISTSLNNISKSASSCVNDIRSCKFDEEPVPDRNLLPKRKPPPPASQLGTWATKKPMASARLNVTLVAADNGKLYAFGAIPRGPGPLPPNVVLTVEEYDPRTNSWATKEVPLPLRPSFNLAAAGNGKFYTTGGFEYDPANNTWTQKAAPMPSLHLRSEVAVAAASNGKIYVVGGFGSEGHLRLVEEYDPVANAWTTKAPMPTPRRNLGLAAAKDGKLYAVGGFGGFGDILLDTVEEYDPVTDAWTTKAPMITARQDLGLAALGNGKLYAVGGSLGAIVEEYDPATNSWAPRAPMLTARMGLGLAAANGKLYAVGGRAGPKANDACPTTEEYTP